MKAIRMGLNEPEHDEHTWGCAAYGDRTLRFVIPDLNHRQAAMRISLLALALLVTAVLTVRSANAQGGSSRTPTLEKVRTELLEMERIDQAIRSEHNGDAVHQERMRRADSAHTRRLQTMVAEHGWLTAAKVGKDGADAAWLLAQHADHDVAFQRRVLELIQQLPTGTVRDHDVAYLTDRVLVNESKPQRYGTQFHPVNGRMVLQSVEDSANLNKRRTAMGLPLLEVHLQWLTAHVLEDSLARIAPFQTTDVNEIKKELLQRGAREQELRKKLEGNLPDSALLRVMHELETVDESNTAWLKQVVARVGWPDSVRFGAQASQAAFLLVQHADHDPAFQETMLPMLIKAAQQNQIRKLDVAYLTDRVRIKQGRPQVYGTQYVTDHGATGGGDHGAGQPPVYQIPMVEDVERIDERRRQMGLGPWREYEERMAKSQGRTPVLRPRAAAGSPKKPS